MTKVKYLETLPSERSSPPCKISIQLVVQLVLVSVSYVCGWEDRLSFSYQRISEGEVWRFLTSLLASEGPLGLAASLVSCLVLSYVSERPRGSVVYFFDCLIKVALVNLCAMAFYIGLLVCAMGFGGLFNYAVEVQNRSPGGGFQFLLLLEVFQVLSGGQRNGFQYPAFSRCFRLLLVSLFAAIAGLSFSQLPFFAALAVGLLFRLRAVRYEELVRDSAIVVAIEKRLRCLSCVLYLNDLFDEPNPLFFKAPDAFSSESKQINESTELSGEAPPDPQPEHEEATDDKVSRYAKINVDEFMIAHKSSSPQNPDESFEI